MYTFKEEKSFSPATQTVGIAAPVRVEKGDSIIQSLYDLITAVQTLQGLDARISGYDAPPPRTGPESNVSLDTLLNDLPGYIGALREDINSLVASITGKLF